LPVARARLKIGATDVSCDVRPDATAAVFQADLPAGEIELETWFLDAQGEELCGAYYAYVQREHE
jgi:hypothetical protein